MRNSLAQFLAEATHESNNPVSFMYGKRVKFNQQYSGQFLSS